MNFSQEVIDVLKEQNVLPMKSKEILLDTGVQKMPLDLVSMEEVTVSPDRRQFLIDNMTPLAKEIYGKQLNGATASSTTHAYNNIEYYCKQGLLYMSRDALAYMKANPKADLLMNVFGAEFLKKDLDPIKRLNIQKPVFTLPASDKAVLRTFCETTYKQVADEMFALYINLDYDFYKNIYVPEKALYYDIDTGKVYFCFAEVGSDEYNEWLDQALHSMQPIVMTIREGRIVGVENIEELIIAKFLHLPSVPAIVVASSEREDYEQVVPLAADVAKANEVFAPYFSWDVE